MARQCVIDVDLAGVFARPRRMGYIATLMLMTCAICACAPNAAYRTRIAPDAGLCAGPPDACSGEVWQRLVSSGGSGQAQPIHPVHLGYVEFDDQGALHHPELKEELLARIRALRKAHPLLILVFAHGWKHNASASDANVVEFAGILQRIAVEDEKVCAGQPCSDRRVVGVYLGWRGLSASVEPLKALSFWTRKSRAHRVGTDGATEVLADLKKISAGDSRDRLILAGHSFGGALIYTAIQQQLMRDTAFPKNEIVPREVADLIVLVNPAFEAARFRALHRRMRNMEHSDKQRPILAVFTSRNDTATRTAFPVGRSLNTFFQQYTSDEQRRENRTALGHYEPFQTHDLNLTATAPSRVDVPLQLTGRYADYRCDWQDFQSGKTEVWSLRDLELSRRPAMRTDAQRRNPYLNVSVDPGIIASHSDIWGERFSEFLYRFVAVQSGRPPAACRR